jgi:hypothetical protein
MKRRVVVTILFVAGVAAAGSAPAIARAIRGDARDRCALDGAAIDPLARVRVLDERSTPHGFCCVHCAERWIEKSGGKVGEILVTDETSGSEVTARAAWFVWSRAAGVTGSASRVHVFANEQDARRHAAAFAGTVLTGDERPFRGKE